jgi:hypothetical protein
MSKVFPWWDKTITLYNKYVDPTTQAISWYRTVIEDCFWKNVNNTYYVGTRGISTTGVKLETKEIVCRIPEDERYVDRQTWEELDDRTENFTIGNGDIIVLGEVDDVIDETIKGQRSTDLVTKYKKYDSCLMVDTYVINTYTGVSLKHYRVVGA